MESYSRKRDQLGMTDIMVFHRKHLLLFMNRFLQFASVYPTPSSALLSHELFLVVEAATNVAKVDWERSISSGTCICVRFADYFEGFALIRTGTASLIEGSKYCIAALSEAGTDRADRTNEPTCEP